MKKILLIVGMILCVGVIGSVFALSVFPAEKDVTVTADGYIYLGFDGTSDVQITLESGVPTTYTVSLEVERNAGSGKFEATWADGTDVDLDDVTIEVFNDEDLDPSHKLATGGNVTVTANSVTVTGITENTNYYFCFTLADNATQDMIDECGGTLTLSFTAVE